MITRRAVPQSFDCFGIVFLLYPLTFTLDNIVATLAKHPILCRYFWIETPILEGRCYSVTTTVIFRDKQSEAVRISSSPSYNYSSTYLFENPMQNCGFKEPGLTRLEGNLNLKLRSSFRSSSHTKNVDSPRNVSNVLKKETFIHLLTREQIVELLFQGETQRMKQTAANTRRDIILSFNE